MLEGLLQNVTFKTDEMSKLPRYALNNRNQISYF